MSPSLQLIQIVYTSDYKYSLSLSLMSSFSCTALGFFLLLVLVLPSFASHDYGLALTKSLLFYEAQRSGKLPSDQRVPWRANSALTDGKSQNVNLVGGYYDAGDNVKFGFPMAFTVTMLAWSVIEFGAKLEAKNELENALTAIKWGTDYFIRAHPEPNLLYGEVGDGQSDHACWQRPEDMTTPRTPYAVNSTFPGSDLAAETAAAFAAASISFRKRNPRYASQLITHSKQLFDFADKYRGKYQNSIPAVFLIYPSSGFEDELLWGAAWLFRATKDKKYLKYIRDFPNPGGVRSAFSWDDKFTGAQMLIAKLLSEANITGSVKYKDYAEQFICNCIQKGNQNWKLTKGGLLWYLSFNNLQYVNSASFIIITYAQQLQKAKKTMHCPRGEVKPQDLVTFVKSQVDYVLGVNPKKTSYMVGYGSNYPRQVHHRGASIVSIKQNRTVVTCKGGFNDWFNRKESNPNVIEGAIVGGPDLDDSYNDSRSNFQQSEAATYNNAPLVGVLAYFV